MTRHVPADGNRAGVRRVTPHMTQLTRFLTLSITLLLGITTLGVLGAAPASADESDLRGTDWRLVRIETYRGDTGAIWMVGRTSADLRVRRDGISFDTGCNAAGGKVEVGDRTMRISRVMSTAMACPGKRRRIERQVVRTLRGTVTYRAGEKRLRVTKKTRQGQRTLVYRAR